MALKWVKELDRLTSGQGHTIMLDDKGKATAFVFKVSDSDEVTLNERGYAVVRKIPMHSRFDEHAHERGRIGFGPVETVPVTPRHVELHQMAFGGMVPKEHRETYEALVKKHGKK